MDVIKVKPWGKNQGDYVLINAADFDKEKHELYEVKKPTAPVKKTVVKEPKE